MTFPPDTDLGRTVRPHTLPALEDDFRRTETPELDRIIRQERICCGAFFCLVALEVGALVVMLSVMAYSVGRGWV